MKAVKAFGPQELRVVDTASPDPGVGEVLIAVRACGICGSDKWFWHVEGPSEHIAGHEAAGEVIAVGDGVKHLKIGDRVAVNNVKGCGRCRECLAGAYVRCQNGLTHMGHGFSERIAVPERNCLLLHDDVSYEAGCLIFDNFGTPFSAISRTQMANGDHVVVSGCGPIGLAAVILAKTRGAQVTAVDPVPSRLEAARRAGADAVWAPGDAAVEEILRWTDGLGADIWLECSGKASSYEMAFASMRMGGTIVSIGEGAILECRVSEMLIHRHMNWLGSLYSTMSDGEQVQDLIVNGQIDPLSIVTHRFSLRELPEKFGMVFEQNHLLKAIVIVE